MKKIASLAVALLLMFTLCVPAFAKENASGAAETSTAINFTASIEGTPPPYKYGSALSEGNIWIIAAVAAVIVIGGAVIIITVNNKKK